MIDYACENILILEQGAGLLRRLDDEAYRLHVENVEVSSVGAHMRHIFDHYSSFFAGIESGTVDYDERQRQKVLEIDRQAALNMAHIVCQRLSGLDEHHFGSLWVCSYSGGKSSRVASSPIRELDFLLSHTIHHFAIIAVLCRLRGLDVDRDFGVAPSTLRYQRALELPREFRMIV